ncbi:hypothetical protein E2562_013599 [Oryza meyeriana var. granulata]|uniref:Uncharacterized protein n=1 Tax=Oryza meyeriana var. granulata TaxID=110450 RepID=A0A6G1C6S5_9ORYZ|nr:hypothetical protein E2562_013599 [Oryza meyeriana var. granulata]
MKCSPPVGGLVEGAGQLATRPNAGRGSFDAFVSSYEQKNLRRPRTDKKPAPCLPSSQRLPPLAHQSSDGSPSSPAAASLCACSAPRLLAGHSWNLPRAARLLPDHLRCRRRRRHLAMCMLGATGDGASAAHRRRPQLEGRPGQAIVAPSRGRRACYHPHRRLAPPPRVPAAPSQQRKEGARR